MSTHKLGNFNLHDADPSQCMAYMRETLVPLVALLQRDKDSGKQRSDTDYWFPIWRPSIRFKSATLSGKSKYAQISFASMLQLSNDDAHILLQKVSRLWRKKDSFLSL